jgi:uncharacterized protein
MPRACSRRSFLASGLAAVAAGAASGGSARKYKFIDIHTHVGTFWWGRELTADGLVRLMDRHDIGKAVVLPLVSPESTNYLQTSEAALAAAKAHPDRLIAFCAVDPRVNYPRGYCQGVKGLVSILSKYRDLGARGFGEHKVGLPFDHPLMMDVYAACDELQLPFLFHLDDARGVDTPGLPRLEHALKTFPRLPFIGHAAGFWASISADATFADFGRYPKIPTPVAPGGALDLLMARHRNLYGDLSEPGGFAAIARDLAFGREFLIRHADQLVFGSDFLEAHQTIPHFALYDSLKLPNDVEARIFRTNAESLLKLS